MNFVKFFLLLVWCSYVNADILSLRPVPFTQVERDQLKIENVYELVSSNKQFGGISGLKIKKIYPLSISTYLELILNFHLNFIY